MSGGRWQVSKAELANSPKLKLIGCGSNNCVSNVCFCHGGRMSSCCITRLSHVVRDSQPHIPTTKSDHRARGRIWQSGANNFTSLEIPRANIDKCLFFLIYTCMGGAKGNLKLRFIRNPIFKGPPGATRRFSQNQLVGVLTVSSLGETHEKRWEGATPTFSTWLPGGKRKFGPPTWF